jgi:hydrogenase maturation protease
MTTKARKACGRLSRRPRILIAGLGNLLLRDDGVGVHAVRQFQKSGGKDYRAIDVGCAVLDALHLFEWAEKILLIDAMKAGGPPGTVYKVSAIDDIDSGDIPSSLHELSVVHSLRMINKDYQREVSIIGIEPEIIDYGLELSEAVEATLPLVLHTGQEIVGEWLREYEIRSSSGASDEFNSMRAVSSKYDKQSARRTMDYV